METILSVENVNENKRNHVRTCIYGTEFKHQRIQFF